MNVDAARPRVGQLVHLHSGAVGEVVEVIRGVDCLRIKTEAEVLQLGPTMQAALGADWVNRYYEATVMFGSGRLGTVTPRDVASVSNQD